MPQKEGTVQKAEVPKEKASETVMVADGFSPVARKTVLRIQSGEYVDLEELLKSPHAKSDTPLPRQQEGVLVVQSMESLKKRRPQITSYAQWVEAFAIYVAVASQKHLMVLIKEACALGGVRWINYDRKFRQMAAAKKLEQ